jgi:Na+/proline symporter
MPQLNLDILIFVVFLAVNLIVGIKYRGKKQTFKEYAIGNKDFSTATLVATIVATWASGSFFFYYLEQTYSNGLYYIIPATVGGSLSWLITAYIIGPRMGAFLNHVSMADALSHIYGKRVQVIVALSTVLFNIGYVAIQFKVISRILSTLFDYQGPWVTIIAASIVIVYSAFGGIRSVTFTDVIQFITFGTLIPVLALVVWQHIPDHSQVIHTLTTHPNFSFKHLVKWSPQLKFALVWICYCMAPSLQPELFQRMAMARNISQIKRSIVYSTGFLLLIGLLISWIAILLLSENPFLDTSQVVSYLIEKHTYTGLKGFLGVGIIALAMSSADSALNSCAVLMANDILPPLGITKQASVRVATITTFVIGFFAILLTLSIQNILKILLFSANFDLPVLTIPILLTIFGFRTSKRAMYIGMGAGFLTSMFLWIYFKDDNSFSPGILANLVFLLGSHYLLKEKGGWIKQGQETALDVTQAYPITWKDRWKQVKEFKLLAYLEKNLPNKDHYYPLLAFYLLTATYVSLYNLSHAVEQQYLTIYRTIQYSVLVITTGLLAFPIWPAPLKNKRLLAWLWPLIIFYTLFFVGGMLVIISGFQSNQLLIFMLNIVMTVLLIHWPLALTLAISGLVAASLVFKWSMDEIILTNQAIPLSFQLGYGLLLFSSLLIALFRFKQANKNLENKHEYLRHTHQETTKSLLKSWRHEERFIKALDIEGIREFKSLVHGIQQVQDSIQSLETSDFPGSLKEQLMDLKERLTSASHYIQIISHQITAYLRLDVRTKQLAYLLRKSIDLLQVEDLPSIPEVIVKNYARAQEIECDTSKINQLLVNAIVYSQNKQHKAAPIILQVEDTWLGYAIASIKGHIKKVPALCFTITSTNQIPPIEELYIGRVDQASPWFPQTQEEISINANQRIIEAHYGQAYLDVSAEVPIQRYIIPVHIREIRPKEMEDLYVEVDEIKPLSDEIYPGAAEQETAFLEAVATKTTADMATVEKALKLIKKYHGPVKRKSGEPFYLHPVAVANILLSYTQDEDTIISALLHDTVEDTALSLPQIGLMFNTRVQHIVDGVTHLDSNFHTLYKIKLADYENIKQLLEAEDIRVLHVKLADRLHNMRTIQYHSSYERKRQIAKETLQFFVPIAQHLGLIQAMEELEKLSFEVLNKGK